MNTAANDDRQNGNDFYLTTLAPVNDRRRTCFGAADGVILIVLFLEITIIVRLFLAS